MVAAVFIVAMGLAISPIGALRLGGKEAKPTIRFFDWCAVLICTLLAGGGVFWSAAEPLFHFQTPAPYFSFPLGLPRLGAGCNNRDDHLLVAGGTG